MGLGIRTSIETFKRKYRAWYADQYLLASIGKDCDLRPGCVIENGKPGRGKNYRGISLGNRVTLSPGVVLTTDFHIPEAGIEIGDDVWINRNTLIQGSGGVTIGKKVLIGPAVIIWSSGHKYDAPGAIFDQDLKFAQIFIDDGAWIGAGSIILPGRRIGKGSIVGAGSVVTRDVEAGEIVRGNPIEKIGEREV